MHAGAHMSLGCTGHCAIDAAEPPPLPPYGSLQHVQHHPGLAEQERLVPLCSQLLQELHDEHRLAGA